MLNDWINPSALSAHKYFEQQFNHPSQDKQHNNKSRNK